MIPLYTAGRQLVKVRALTAFAVACAALALLWGARLARAHGASPGDGGALAPLAERLAVGGVVAALGLAFAAGMLVYASCYVSRLVLDPQRAELHVHTAALLGRSHHVVDVGRVGGGRYHAGELRLDVTVRAPWVSLRLPGRRLPLVVDAQGEVLDRALLRRHLGWGGGQPTSGAPPA